MEPSQYESDVALAQAVAALKLPPRAARLARMMCRNLSAKGGHRPMTAKQRAFVTSLLPGQSRRERKRLEEGWGASNEKGIHCGVLPKRPAGDVPHAVADESWKTCRAVPGRPGTT